MPDNLKFDFQMFYQIVSSSTFPNHNQNQFAEHNLCHHHNQLLSFTSGGRHRRSHPRHLLHHRCLLWLVLPHQPDACRRRHELRGGGRAYDCGQSSFTGSSFILTMTILTTMLTTMTILTMTMLTTMTTKQEQQQE